MWKDGYVIRMIGFGLGLDWGLGIMVTKGHLEVWEDVEGEEWGI